VALQKGPKCPPEGPKCPRAQVTLGLSHGNRSPSEAINTNVGRLLKASQKRSKL